MATFDVLDWTKRLIYAPGVPKSWFSDSAKSVGGVLYAVMSGLATGFALISAQQAYGKLQTRIASKTDQNLDGTSQDFFAGKLPRASGEQDPSFSTRIRQRTVAPINTGPAMKDTVNAYLEVATPLERCDVFDAGDAPGRAATYDVEPGSFAVELHAPVSDLDLQMTLGNCWLGFTYTAPSRYRVWGIGNHGLGRGGSGTPLTVPLASRRVPENVVDPNVSGLIDDAKADGIEPAFRYFFE